MNTDNKTAILALTPNAKKLGLELAMFIENSDVYVSQKIKNEDQTQVIEGRFSDFVGKLFNIYSNLIFIMATGIVVRSIAPYIQDKRYDPAIIVMDEKANNVISLLSGHIGGGNELTLKIAKKIGSNPVVTTATDVNGKGALDLFVKDINARLENFKECTKFFNMALIQDKKLGILVDIEGVAKIDELKFDEKTIKGFEILENIKDTSNLNGLVLVTNKENSEVHKSLSNIFEDLSKSNKSLEEFEDKKIMAKVLAKNIIISIGCKRGKTLEELRSALNKFMEINNLNIKSIIKIGTVDLKADEIGIIELAKELDVPMEIVSRSEIESVQDLFEKSEFVKKSIGVYSVVNPVAHILSEGHIIVKRQGFDGITMAAGIKL